MPHSFPPPSIRIKVGGPPGPRPTPFSRLETPDSSTLEFLFADDVDVLPVPDFHSGGIVVGLLDFDLLGPVGDAYVNDGSILRPLRCARRDDALGSVDPDRALVAQVLPREDGVALAFEAVLLRGAQRGQVARFLAPRERGENRGAIVEDLERARGRIENLDGVAGAAFDANGHGEVAALILPGVRGDVAKSGIDAALAAESGNFAG